jgi:hypothetical protein
MSGLTVYNGTNEQFSTKYPALLVDRTNDYGYKNYQITFTTNPPLPPDPPQTAGGNTSSIYIDILDIYHGLGYIPAFESVTTAYGVASLSRGISMWNEDALVSITNYGFASTTVSNRILFRADSQYLHIKLFRQSATDYDMSYTIYRPPSLAGVQLNINTQIFAMGLNDISSQVQ